MNIQSNQRPAVVVQKKNILVVDDDPSILCYLEIGLSSYPGLHVISAENGARALERLAEGPVDLIVTDIQMPEMDGMALVSHLTRHYPRLPVIVVTAHGSEATAHKLNRLGIVSYLKKPLEIDALAERVFDLLVGVDSGYVHGISIASFLQLLHADTKTCCLRITIGERVGFLHFVNGEIWDAKVDAIVGVPAAMEIVSWEDDLTIDIQNLVRLKERTIDMDVTFLIMEACRRKDEEGHVFVDDETALNRFLLPERGSIFPDSSGRQPAGCDNQGIPITLTLSSRQQFILFECLTRLRDIQGYKASAILSHSGTLLASHSLSADEDIELFAQGVHEMFAGLVKRGHALGLADWEETVFRSSLGAVLVRCSATATMPHVHVIAVTDDLPSEGLLRIRLKRVLDETTAKLAEMIGVR